MLKIRTNNLPRDLVPFHALPEKARKDFDYLDEDEQNTDRFVNYKGEWYDTLDTQAIRVSNSHDLPMGWAMYVNAEDQLAKWDAIISDSYFSGVLFRFSQDYDQVVCATYYSTSEA
jgi:hypothetical protein